VFKLDCTHFLIVPEGSQSFGLLHLHNHQQLSLSIILGFLTVFQRTMFAHPSWCSSCVPKHQPCARLWRCIRHSTWLQPWTQSWQNDAGHL